MAQTFLPIDVLHDRRCGTRSELRRVSSRSQTWLENGATDEWAQAADDRRRRVTERARKRFHHGFDPTMYKANANFTAFKNDIQPIPEGSRLYVE